MKRSKKLADKVRRLLAATDRGKKAYGEADELLDEVLAELGTGNKLDLGNGESFEIVDRFASANKAFQPGMARRYESKITRA